MRLGIGDYVYRHIGDQVGIGDYIGIGLGDYRCI